MAVGPGLHVDSQGNLHIGSTRETFDSTTISEAPFSVTKAGVLNATSGSYSGNITGGSIDIGGSDASSFHVDTDGNMFLGAGTIGSAPFKVSNAGAVTATSGTIGGISLNASDIQANYSAGTTGFKIDSSGGAEFNGPILSFGKATGTPSGAGTTSIKLGDAVLFSRDEGSAGNHLFSTKPFVVMADGSEDNPSLTIQGDYEKMGFFLVTNTDFNLDTFKLSNGDDDIWSVNSNSTTFTILGNLTVDGSTLTVNGDSGGNSQFLGYNSSGTLGFHSISVGSHNHDSDYYSASAGATLASSLSSHTGHATSLSLNSNVTNDDSGGLFVTAVSGLSITRTNIAGTTMDTQKVRPHLSETYALGESGKKYTIGYFQFGTSSSDERLKENIESLDLGLDFINKLEPKKYNWTTETITLDNGEQIIKREDIANMDMFGFLAQDVLAIDDLDDDTTYGIARHIVEEDTYEISNENFIAPLVKAIQELSAKNDELESRLAALEG